MGALWIENRESKKRIPKQERVQEEGWTKWMRGIHEQLVQEDSLNEAEDAEAAGGFMFRGSMGEGEQELGIRSASEGS